MYSLLELVKYNPDGLVPVIVQDHKTLEVLMMAFMNENTLQQTLKTGIMTYWSRSRKEVWVKGQSSGNTQVVKDIRIDCDGDALLFRVHQDGGAACHTGFFSCFFRRVEGEKMVILGEPVFDPKLVYGDKTTD